MLSEADEGFKVTQTRQPVSRTPEAMLTQEIFFGSSSARQLAPGQLDDLLILSGSLDPLYLSLTV